MWRLRWAGRFKKQYKNLDPNTQQDVDEAVREIALSVNPASLGTYKSNMRVFAYEIGRKYRVIYSIQYRDRDRGSASGVRSQVRIRQRVRGQNGLHLRIHPNRAKIWLKTNPAGFALVVWHFQVPHA